MENLGDLAWLIDLLCKPGKEKDGGEWFRPSNICLFLLLFSFGYGSIRFFHTRVNPMSYAKWPIQPNQKWNEVICSYNFEAITCDRNTGELAFSDFRKIYHNHNILMLFC